MKLKLAVHRKVGAPGYGSDGASAEVEVEIDGTPAAIAAGAPIWYTALEQAVAAELARLQAAHPQPQPASKPATQCSERPPARRPEPGWDDEPPPTEPQLQNGRKRPQALRNTGREDPPRTGPQLAGWMMQNDGRKKAVEDWGRSKNMPWRVKTWPDEAAQACHHDVTARASAGTWGGR